MSFWNHYSGKSIGRAIHFIYTYCDLNKAEQCIFDLKNNITYNEKKFATITWSIHNYEGIEIETPKFEFVDQHYQEKQRFFINLAVVTLKEFKDKLKDKNYFDLFRTVYNECFKNYQDYTFKKFPDYNNMVDNANTHGHQITIAKKDS